MMRISFYMGLWLLLSQLTFSIELTEFESLVVRSPTPPYSNMSGVISNGDLVVAVNPSGQIIKSEDDGVSWDQVATVYLQDQFLETEVPAAITDIAYSGTAWVAVTTQKQWLRSEDLVHWEAGPLPKRMFDLLYLDGRFIANAAREGNNEDNSTLFYSEDDGFTWLPMGTPVRRPLEVSDFEYGNGVFVGIDREEIYYSSDGSVWNQVALTLESRESFSALAFVAGTFVANGTEGVVYTSTNGMDWTPRDLDTDKWLRFPAIEDPEGKVSIPLTSQLFQLSDSLESFTIVPTLGGVTQYARTDAGTLLAFGNQNIWGRREQGAAEWSASNNSLIGEASEEFDQVLFEKGLFIALSKGEGLIFSSADGINWTQRLDISRFGTELAFDGETFRAFFGSSGEAYISTDGINWNVQMSNIVGEGEFATIRDLKYLNNRWVIRFGSGTDQLLGESLNGVDWTIFDPEVDFFIQSMTYGDGLYVMGGSDPLIWTSPNLRTWTARTVLNSNETGFTNIIFGNGRFVALAQGIGVPALSENGISWTVLPNQFNIPLPVGGYDEDFGFYALPRGGELSYFPKNASLQDVFIEGTRFQGGIQGRSIAEGNNTTVLVGDKGLIMSTPPRTPSYLEWVVAEFGSTGQQGITGENQDPDEDGASNLEEYARGTDPEVKDPDLLIDVVRAPSGPGIAFNQRQGLVGFSSVMEYSTNLESASWSSEGVVRKILGLGNNMETMTGRVGGEIANAEELYFRVRWVAD